MHIYCKILDYVIVCIFSHIFMTNMALPIAITIMYIVIYRELNHNNKYHSFFRFVHIRNLYIIIFV